jgi:hypothetical protein
MAIPSVLRSSSVVNRKSRCESGTHESTPRGKNTHHPQLDLSVMTCPSGPNRLAFPRDCTTMMCEQPKQGVGDD